MSTLRGGKPTRRSKQQTSVSESPANPPAPSTIFRKSPVIRLALVIPALNQSGAERQLTLLATGLPKDQFKVHVFALNSGGYYVQSLRDHGIDCTVIGKCCRFDPRHLLKLRRCLRQFSPDLIQSFLFGANTSVRLPGISPSPQTPVIISERCVDSWKSRWQLTLDRLLIPRTTAMTVNSRSVGEFYAGLGIPADRLRVIHNAAVIPTQQLSRNSARSQLGLSDQSFVIGYVGRLAKQKRLQDLIWAFHMLQMTTANVHLAIIGDGPERDFLKDFANHVGCSQHVTFCGHQPNAASLYAGFDCFVLPSEFEGMSNSLMEAMQAGLPCIVSNIPANAALVTHEHSGLCFPTGDSVQLAGMIKRLKASGEIASQLGHNARDSITRDFSLSEMIRRHTDLYGTLLDR